MIEFKNLSAGYSRNDLVIKNADLTLNNGQITVLLGRNGSGKTTLMKSILGFHPYQGEILLDGEKITKKNIAKFSFATSEHSFFPNLTPIAHKEFYQEHFPKFSETRFHGLMDFFELPKHRVLRSF